MDVEPSFCIEIRPVQLVQELPGPFSAHAPGLGGLRHRIALESKLGQTALVLIAHRYQIVEDKLALQIPVRVGRSGPDGFRCFAVNLFLLQTAPTTGTLPGGLPSPSGFILQTAGFYI